MPSAGNVSPALTVRQAGTAHLQSVYLHSDFKSPHLLSTWRIVVPGDSGLPLTPASPGTTTSRPVVLTSSGSLAPDARPCQKPSSRRPAGLKPSPSRSKPPALFLFRFPELSYELQKVRRGKRCTGVGFHLFTHARRETTRQITCQRFFVWTACPSVSGLGRR
jgi:hypothetical protein